MSSTIKIRRSAIAGKVPTTTDLTLGELGLNTNDARLFTKRDDGTESIVELSGGPILEPAYLISENITLRGSRNGLSFGIVEISENCAVTVPANATWKVLD